MQIAKKLFLGLLLIVLAAYIGISVMLSNRVLNSNSSMERTLKDIPIHWNTTFEVMMSQLPEPEAISIGGFEDIAIHGQYFNVSDSAQCIFIFSHGWGRNWPNMLKYYPAVKNCGCNVFMYDHRAHGESEGAYPTGGIKEAEDLIKVTEWVTVNKNYTLDQIAWLGSSWGAATALLAGATDIDPAFIIADSPFQDWYSAVFERAIRDYGAGIKAIAPGVFQVVNMRAGIDYKKASPLNHADKINEPVLLIHSEGDPETGSIQSVNIAKNLNNRSEFHHTQWGNKHVMDVINNRDEIENLILDFIEKNNFTYFIPPDLAADSLGN